MADGTAIVDGLAVAYSQSGQGPDILLLHGWGDSRRTFKHLVEALAKEHRVTALDLPGFGASQPPKSAWNLTNYAVFLKSFCVKLGVSPFIVIGHSNGGALAIHATSLGHLNPQKMVLLAPSGIRSGKTFKRAVIKIIAKTGKLATVWLPHSTRKRLQTALYGTIGSDMLVAPALQETFKLTVRQDVQKDARKLKIPTLLLYGSEDKATSVKDVGNGLSACIPGSKLIVVPGAGHFIHHDATTEVEKLIQDFIK